MIKTFMRRPILRGLAIASLGVGVIGCYAFAQQGGFDPERMKREALAQPFIGVTTDGTPQPGLYDIESTGVPAAEVVAAAHNFFASMPE